MRSKYTPIPSTTDTTVLSVPAGGRLAASGETVGVLVNLRFVAALRTIKWRAYSNKRNFVTIFAKVDKKNTTLAAYIWRLEYGRHPEKLRYHNDDTFDMRIENLTCIGRQWAVDEVDASGHLLGMDHAHHAYIDVKENLRDRANAVLLGRSNSRAQYARNGNSLSEPRRRAILDRDGGICFYCEYEADQVDHIIPYAHGGTDDDNNLIACCSICNQIASDQVFDTLDQKREFIRAQYGRWMEKRYRRMLRQTSVCSDCRRVYNPQEWGATAVLCKDCYRADCLGLNGALQ